MTWASRQTTPMPTITSGRHRRRVRQLGAAGVLTFLALTVVAAAFSPAPLGLPSQRQPGEGAPSTVLTAGTRPEAAAGVGPGSGAAASAPPTPKSPTAPAQPALTAAPMTALEADVLARTNAERAKKQCAALRLDTRLRTAARAHSEEMARYDTMTHTGRDGSSPGERMKAAGYDTSKGWAENVASGFRTAQAVMTGWMNSAGHRANILNCRYRAIGVGVARADDGVLYWTQNFGGS